MGHNRHLAACSAGTHTSEVMNTILRVTVALLGVALPSRTTEVPETDASPCGVAVLVSKLWPAVVETSAVGADCDGDDDSMSEWADPSWTDQMTLESSHLQLRGRMQRSLHLQIRPTPEKIERIVRKLRVDGHG
jgi:hypothetical protein